MTFVNLLGFPGLPLTKLASICKLFDLFTHGRFYGVFQVCYIMFWDEITLAIQEAQMQKFGADHYVKKWHIIIMVKTLPFVGLQLNGEIPKLLAEGPLIVREHPPLANMFMCLHNTNMFPVCTQIRPC